MADGIDLDALADQAQDVAPASPPPGIDLDALADQAEAPKGPLATAFDTAAQGAQNLQNKIVGGAKELWNDVEPLVQGIEPAFPTVNTLVSGAGTALDVLNRAAGTSIAAVADPILQALQQPNSLIGAPLSPDTMTFAQRAKQRQALNGSEYPVLDKFIPVRLCEDVAYPVGEGAFKEVASLLRKPGNPTINDIAYVVDGFAPGAGMAASFLAAANMPIPTFGALTEAGKAAEMSGELSNGVALQMAKGERGLVGAEVGGILAPKAELFNVGGKSAAKIVDRMNALVTKAEVAELNVPFTKIGIPNPLQVAGKLLSKTSHEGVNNMVEDFNMAKNQIAYESEQFKNSVGMKFKSMGLDLSDPTVRKGLNDYLDNPSKFENVTGMEKQNAAYQFLNDNLQAEVEKSRMAGVPVPDKNFSLVDEEADPSSLSERYVPRGADLDKRQQLMMKAKLGTLEDVQKQLDQVTDGRFGGKKTGTFQLPRSNLNREAMNNFMKEKYGIDDFFHDDIIRAYAEKIADLKSARAQKDFADNLISTFGKDESEYLGKIQEARLRVDATRAAGGIPTSDDVYMGALQPRGLSQYNQLPEPVRNRLRSIGVLSNPNELEYIGGKTSDGVKSVILKSVKSDEVSALERFRLPEEIASYVSDALYKPRLEGVANLANEYQNAMKSFMFFNPGHHIRHFVQSMSRNLGYGVGLEEYTNASTALFRDVGPYKQYANDFKMLNGDVGMLSDIDQTGQAVKGTLSVPQSYLDEYNPMKRMGSAFKEMVAKGSWKGFLADLQSGKAAIRDNPIFRFATQTGVNGENLSRFALFSKFREEGYVAEEAMRKVNTIFPDYQITRDGIKKARLAVPFANFFVKNAETTLKILAEAPRGVAVMGPQGALQRSIENWSNYDPERTYKYKKLFGSWADDYILLSSMPAAENMDKNPDFIKKMLTSWQSGLPEGETPWLRLPSNLHAMKNLDPSKLSEDWGPLVRAAYAMMGKDPFSDQDIIGKGTSQQSNERWKQAISELTAPMVPNNIVGGIQAFMDNHFHAFSDKLLNAGLPDGAVKAIFGSDLEEDRLKAQRSLAKIKSLWVGGATQLDLQAFFAASARMKDAKTYLDKMNILNDRGARSDKSVDKAEDELEKAYDDVEKIWDTNEEFQDAIDRQGGVPNYSIDYVLNDAVSNPPKDQPIIPENDEDLNDAELNQMLEDVSDGRKPQSVLPTTFARATQLTKKYLHERAKATLEATLPTERAVGAMDEVPQVPPEEESDAMTFKDVTPEEATAMGSREPSSQRHKARVFSKEGKRP